MSGFHRPVSPITGNLVVDGNLTVKGSTSLDNGLITTDGSGNLNAGNGLVTASQLAVLGSSSLDNGGIVTDGSGNITFEFGGQTINSVGNLTIDLSAGNLIFTVPAASAISMSKANITTLAVLGTLTGIATFDFAQSTNRLVITPVNQNTSATLPATGSAYRFTGSVGVNWTAPVGATGVLNTMFYLMSDPNATANVTLVGFTGLSSTTLTPGQFQQVRCTGSTALASTWEQIG